MSKRSPAFAVAVIMRSVTAALAVAIAFMHCSAFAETPERDRPQLKEIADGYSKNRESFHHFTCEFTLSGGLADSVDAAVAGKLTKKTTERKGRWLVNGDKVFYELSGDDDGVIKEIENQLKLKKDKPFPGSTARFVGSPGHVPSIHYLGSGALGLNYSIVLGAGTIYSPDNHRGLEFTPWSMSIMGEGEEASPGALILKSFDTEKFYCDFDGMKTINGTKFASVSFGTDRDNRQKSRQTFMLDPAKGYLPIRYSWTDAQGTGLFDQLFITNVIPCSNGRWFPGRSVNIYIRGKEKGPYGVVEYQVTKLDADTEPNDDEFFLDLSGGAIINDGKTIGAQIHLAGARRLRPADLAGIKQDTIDEAKKSQNQ